MNRRRDEREKGEKKRCVRDTERETDRIRKKTVTERVGEWMRKKRGVDLCV
jgi:hypothetical protein